MSIMRVQFHFNPVTAYLLCLGLYSMLMFVHTVQQHQLEKQQHHEAVQTKSTSQEAKQQWHPQPEQQQQQEQATEKAILSRKRRSSSGGMEWLVDVTSFVGRVAQGGETRCADLRAITAPDDNCSGSLVCLDEAIVPRNNRCIFYTPTLSHGGQNPLIVRLLTQRTGSCSGGSTMSSRNGSNDAGPTNQQYTTDATTHIVQMVIDGRTKLRLLSQLVTSRQLTQVDQVSIVMRIPGSVDHAHQQDSHAHQQENRSHIQLVSLLRQYWRNLESLSSVGFKRVKTLHSNRALPGVRANHTSTDESRRRDKIASALTENDLVNKYVSRRKMGRKKLNRSSVSPEKKRMPEKVTEKTICLQLLYTRSP